MSEKRMSREGREREERSEAAELLFHSFAPFASFARHLKLPPFQPGARGATRPTFHAAVGFSFTCSVCVGKANSKPARSNSSFTRKFKACKPRK